MTSKPKSDSNLRTRRVVVPIMLGSSSAFMALAWLGHLRFQDRPFLVALFLSWLLVLPEYTLNVSAIRYGAPVFSGAQMAAFRLCAGVVWVAVVAYVVLGESLSPRQLAGFGLMFGAMGLIAWPTRQDPEGAT